MTGSWTDDGVIDDTVYSCADGTCEYTGNIPAWPCSLPEHTYAGPDTGYEYAYSFTSPGNGTCTFIEYQEGIRHEGLLIPVVDWFLVPFQTNSPCGPSNCVHYAWENLSDPICGSGIRDTCSMMTFAVEEGQEFFIVADIFAGTDAANPETFAFNEGWTVEIKCDLVNGEVFVDSFEDIVGPEQ